MQPCLVLRKQNVPPQLILWPDAVGNGLFLRDHWKHSKGLPRRFVAFTGVEQLRDSCESIQVRSPHLSKEPRYYFVSNLNHVYTYLHNM